MAEEVTLECVHLQDGARWQGGEQREEQWRYLTGAAQKPVTLQHENAAPITGSGRHRLLPR